MKSIKRAFHEALLALPAEEYDWFDIRAIKERQRRHRGGTESSADTGEAEGGEGESAGEIAGEEIGVEPEPRREVQKEFFDYAGPLHSVRISPASSVIQVGESRTLQAIARDKSRRLVDYGLELAWEVLEGNVTIDEPAAEIVTVHAGREPGLARVRVMARQGEITCEAEALVTITESLAAGHVPSTSHQAGLPNYTFRKAPGELWRSQYDAEQNLIVINNGHRDFIYASRTKALQLRYIARLFAKELVYKNFPGYSADKLLERMIELSLYTEENLK